MTTKVVCNLDTVTHVMINGREYERFIVKDGGEPEGKAILLGLPCKLQEQVSKDKDKEPFKFYCRIGSKWGGSPQVNNALRVDFYPLKSGVTKASETQFVG